MKSNEKGITIIVLIITITVMCILAGVSIRLIVGDNKGVIDEAANARDAAKDMQHQTEELEENTYDDISAKKGTSTDEDKFIVSVTFDRNTYTQLLIAKASTMGNQLPIASYKFYYKKTTDPDSKYELMDKNSKTATSANKSIKLDPSGTNYNIKAVVIDSQGNTVTAVTTTNFK